MQAKQSLALALCALSMMSLLAGASSRARAQAADAGVPESATEPQAEPAQADPGAPAQADAAPAQADAAPPSSQEIQVTVVGTPIARTAGSAHVVRSAQLDRWKRDDPNAVLSTVPGVYVRGEDGFGLRPNIGIRGVNPDRSKKITLLEDGVLFGPAPYSAPAAYYFPIISRMTQVRVIKGPASVTYGPQTVGGAVDLITRPIPDSTAAGIDLSGGDFFYRKAHGYFGSSDGQTGFLVEGLHLANDGFKELPDGADTGFYRNEWMVKVSRILDPSAATQNELRLKLTYSDELSNETYLGLTDEDFRADPLQRYGVSELDRMRNHRISGVATHVLTASQDLSLTTNVYRHDFNRVWRKVNRFRGADLFDVLAEPELPRNQIFTAILRGEADSSTPQETLFIGPNERDFSSQGLDTRLRWSAATGPIAHRMEYGLRLHNDRIERRHSEAGFTILAGEPTPDGGPETVTAFNSAWSYALAAHATDAMTWNALTLTPGVRFEAIQSAYEERITNDETTRWAYAFVPGIGAYYALTPDFGVLAGVYRGFSPPAPGSSEDIDPELSVNYEAGARFSRGPARAELIGFYNDYSNLTDVCTFSSGCTDADLDTQFDAGEARIYGFEAFADYEIALPAALKLPVTLAYTLTRAEFMNTFGSDDPIFGDVEEGDEMPYVPRHTLSGSIGLEHKRAGGNLNLSYVSAMREEAGAEPLADSLATDEQLTFDAALYYRANDPVELYLIARNLFDSHDIVSRRPFGARPNAPRMVQVGVKVTL